ncbi:sugar transferase [Halofilum ochraceum]|uniref:sugar transferase n=1 Tax=Halofilum ochraceum TaxID=1611323 RepID=UPI0009F67E9B|nr:sugar transferase [Halofilum ochraceum]
MHETARTTVERTEGLSSPQATAKRGFDLLVAVVVLVLTFWLILFAWIAATLDTRANGFFTQERVGHRGRPFRVIKLRTMRSDASEPTNVTTSADARITRLGRVFRRTKLDELPQLINVLKGDMSLVGPRPDVPGFADELNGGDRLILTVRPGITGPATLKYRDEEALLAAVGDPEAWNRDVLWPDKVRLNREYVRNWSFRRDLYYLWKTLFA